jgi:Cu-processing system permease protein
VGEAERGCLLLMLTYPVSRLEILLGKFLGHAAILAFATLIGYGGVGLAAALTGSADAESWRAYLGLLTSSVLLGLAFLALAYLVSVLVAERSTAAGIAVGLWLVFVIVFDLALMGLLVASKGGVGSDIFPSLLLLNPADAYRLFNLTAFENVRKLSGLGGLSAAAQFPPAVLLLALVAWIALPLLGAIAVFNRREA